MTEFELKKTRDFGDIITDTFTYIRLNFKSYGLALLYYVIPALLLGAIVFGSAYGEILSPAIAGDAAVNPDEIVGWFGKFMIGMCLMLLSTGLLTTITFMHIRLKNQGQQDIKPQDLLERVIPNILGLMALYIIIGVATIIGFFVFILPGIYLAIRLSLSFPIYIIEDVSIGEAINRSWELISGYWWFTFGLMFVMGIIAYMISSVITVPIMIIVGISSFAGSDPDSIATVISIMYGLIVSISIIFNIVPLLSYSLHYFNLVERKEGSGLRARIEMLGNTESE